MLWRREEKGKNFFPPVNFIHFLSSKPWIRIGIQPKMLDPEPESNESGSEKLMFRIRIQLYSGIYFLPLRNRIPLLPWSANLFAVFKTNRFQILTWQNSGVECSDRERSAGVGERGGATAPAPQRQAHQAAEARDRVQEGQISGQSRNIFITFLRILLTSVLYVWIRREPIVVRQSAERLAT